MSANAFSRCRIVFAAAILIILSFIGTSSAFPHADAAKKQQQQQQIANANNQQNGGGGRPYVLLLPTTTEEPEDLWGGEVVPGEPDEIKDGFVESRNKNAIGNEEQAEGKQLIYILPTTPSPDTLVPAPQPGPNPDPSSPPDGSAASNLDKCIRESGYNPNSVLLCCVQYPPSEGQPMPQVCLDVIGIVGK